MRPRHRRAGWWLAAVTVFVVIADPKNREQFAAQGWEAIGSSPQELDHWVRDEINVWQTFVRESGLELP